MEPQAEEGAAETKQTPGCKKSTATETQRLRRKARLLDSSQSGESEASRLGERDAVFQACVSVRVGGKEA